MLSDIKNIYMKKDKKCYDFIAIPASFAVLLQYVWIVYENLFHIKEYMGYDSSMNLLYTIVSAKEGKMYVENFECTSSQFSTPFQSILYSFSNNVFVSQGIVNIVYLTMILYFSYRIIKIIIEPDVYHVLYPLIVFALLLCPFVNNTNIDLDSFGVCMTYPVAYYVSHVLRFIFVTWAFLRLENVCRFRDIGIVDSVFIIFISGIIAVRIVGNYEFSFINVLMPVMICVVINLLIKNEFKYLATIQACFAYMMLLIFGIGIVLNKCLITHKSTSNAMRWIAVKDFPNNFLAVVAGYIGMGSGLPRNGESAIFSIYSISYITGLIIVGSILVLAVLRIKDTVLDIQNQNKMIPFIASFVFVTFFYSLFDLTYGVNGGQGFEIRYLIVGFISLIFLFISYVSKMESKLLLKICGITIFLLSLIAMTIMSDYIRYNSRNKDTDRLNEIESIIESVNSEAELVYFVGSVKDDVRYIRVIDPNRIYKDIWSTGELYHWGDYTYYDESAEYQGPFVIFCKKDLTDTIPTYVKSSITQCGEWDEYYIFCGEETKYDFKTSCNAPVNYDFPYSPSVSTANLEMNDRGEYISNGEEGIILFGPNYCLNKCAYDIVLEYEVISSNEEVAGVFDIVKNESEVVYSTAIKNDGVNEIGFYDVAGDGQSWFQYRVGESSGTIIKINKVVISKK